MKSARNPITAFVEKHLFFLLVPLPTLVTLVYLLLLAAPRYSSTSQAIIRENTTSSSGALTGLGLSFLNTSNSVSREDGYILIDYLMSQQFMLEADRDLNLREHFSSPTLDIVYRLPQNASREDFLKYYRKHVQLGMNPNSAVLTITTIAFDSEFARNFNNYIIQQSEAVINRINDRMISSQTQFAEDVVEKTKQSLIEAKFRLKEFQLAHSLIDPQVESGSLFARISALEDQLVQAKIEYKRLSQFMNEDSFQIRALVQRISALEKQLAEEGLILASESQPASMVSLLHQYEELKLQFEFSQNSYIAALASLEKSRLDAWNQSKFFLVISQPEEPEEPVYPRPIIGSLTVLLVGILLFGLVKLTIATVRDHNL